MLGFVLFLCLVASASGWKLPEEEALAMSVVVSQVQERFCSGKEHTAGQQL